MCSDVGVALLVQAEVIKRRARGRRGNDLDRTGWVAVSVDRECAKGALCGVCEVHNALTDLEAVDPETVGGGGCEGSVLEDDLGTPLEMDLGA